MESHARSGLATLGKRFSLIPDVVATRSELLHLGEYYNADTARYASWKEFLQAARQEDVSKANMVLGALATAEALWGRPGLAKIEEMKTNVSHGLWKDVVEAAEDVIGRFAVRMESEIDLDSQHPHAKHEQESHFDVLFVQNRAAKGDVHIDVALELSKVNTAGDKLHYSTITVDSFEDAVIAVIYNHDIQAVVFTSDFDLHSDPMGCKYRMLMTIDGFEKLQGLSEFIDKPLERVSAGRPAPVVLAEVLKSIRPELDLYFVANLGTDDDQVDDVPQVRRVFATLDDHQELHFAIMQGLHERTSTPFFEALVEYSKRPVGVFHALAISRGNSVLKSHWISSFLEFYGRNLFQAESSATCGGLDSLLDPRGTLKDAHQKAARAFQAEHTFFVTNGTSTANKIVGQSLLRPGDIVIIDRDCHKSHHYNIVLTGAYPCYVDAYPLHDYSMYGCVPLRSLKQALLDYRKAGKLDRVKLVILTNCTFDGMVYNTERLMEELLAIKPDLVFLWDEAWFAYATFNPVMRRRTGMGAAKRLQEKFRSEEYQLEYQKWMMEFQDDVDTADDEKLLSTRLLANPILSKVRVYVTQSTHKALTSLRQGSMVHIHDELFEKEVEAPFHEAYYTHTSTSPNYQILASLDVGRRQMELEGFQFVNDALENAYLIRRAAAQDPAMSKYIRFLDVKDLVPAEYRQSSAKDQFYDGRQYNRLEDWWLSDDEIVLDPTRLTLYVGEAGIDGDTFKVKWLMDKYDIQVNKTSRNSVLFQTHIGTTTSATAYLLQSLSRAAKERAVEFEQCSGPELKVMERKIKSLTTDAPPLPDFSRFHEAFTDGSGTREGDMRKAYYMCYDQDSFEFWTKEEALAKCKAGEVLVATTFIIPYPPGFPILVPGQVVTEHIIEFLIKLDVKEIHGFDSALGLRCFTKDALSKAVAANKSAPSKRQKTA